LWPIICERPRHWTDTADVPLRRNAALQHGPEVNG
jgi:hypothetical protein